MMSEVRRFAMACRGLITVAALGCGTTGLDPVATQPGQGARGNPNVSSVGPSAGKAAPLAMREAVACGTATCELPFDAAGIVEACCLSDAESTCGYRSSFTMQKCIGMVKSDPQCPEVTIVGVVTAGCCSANGECGIDGSALGMGCVEFGAAASRAAGVFAAEAGMGGSTGIIPVPQRCTPGPGAVGNARPMGMAGVNTNDAGTDDDAG